MSLPLITMSFAMELEQQKVVIGSAFWQFKTPESACRWDFLKPPLSSGTNVDNLVTAFHIAATDEKHLTTYLATVWISAFHISRVCQASSIDCTWHDRLRKSPCNLNLQLNNSLSESNLSIGLHDCTRKHPPPCVGLGIDQLSRSARSLELWE